MQKGPKMPRYHELDVSTTILNDIDDNAPVDVEEGYWADDGNEPVYYEWAQSGHEAAQEYVADGDWGGVEETVWIHVWTWREGTVRDVDGVSHTIEFDRAQYRVALDPEAPACSAAEHDWRAPVGVVGGIRENPGVRGHGGGVISYEVCAHCGCTKIEDTWAQDRVTGVQGLQSVRYDPDMHREAWEQWRIERAKKCVKCDAPVLDPQLQGDERCDHCAEWEDV